MRHWISPRIRESLQKTHIMLGNTGKCLTRIGSFAIFGRILGTFPIFRPPPSLGGIGSTNKYQAFRARSVERGGAGGRLAGLVVGEPSGGEGTWHLARLPKAALVSARGGWEERHIGGAESARGALRCGPRREHWHRQREARGLVIAGQGAVGGR